MKTRILFFALALTAIGCLALHRTHYDALRKIPKQKYTPPGTVWLRDSTFIDETEIRNLDYLEFLYLNKDSVQYYRTILPDTLCWRMILPDSIAKSYYRYYLRHPNYRNYPVVGISYWQAREFCKWRTLMVNRYLYIQAHGGWHNFTADSVNRIQPAEWVTYRLPTKEEWEYAAAAGLDYTTHPLGYENLLDSRNMPVSNTGELKNFMIHSTHITLERGKYAHFLDGNFTQEVYYGKPNCYSVYNILGNVSELIADSLFKGLSYNSTIDGNAFLVAPDWYQKTDSTANTYDYKYTFRYTQPQPWLGFRCVCVINKQPK